MKNRIPVFLICDDNYVPYMATMIASICYNTENFIEFHVIGKGISEENQHKINQMKQNFQNFSIDYKIYDVTKECDIKYLVLSRMTSSTFIRMLLPNLYPEIDRALIMDVDMISMQDISKLWNIDLDNYIFAATLDEPLDAYYIFKDNMNVSVDCKYANCGLMLIDCKKWRDNQITQKCLEIEKQYRDKLNCADQDVINKVFLGNFKEIDSRFNSLLGNEDNIINRHFCYLRKPWFSKFNVEGDLIKNFEDWWKYAQMTPFYERLKLNYNEMTNNGEDNSASKAQRNYKRMEMISCVRNLMKSKGN